MGEGVFGPYAATIRQLASPSHMRRPSKCCTTYAELGAWALGSFASAFFSFYIWASNYVIHRGDSEQHCV